MPDYIPPSNIYDPFGKPVIPAWVRARQAQITSALKFEPPRPKLKKALPLTQEHLADALAELGSVFHAYELEGLDVWFVKLVDMDRGTGHNVILYEFRGEWLCSSIERVKLFRLSF
jgi:hypothetical protein